MANSTKLGLPLVSADQSQKHVTVNQSLSELDALVQPSVKSVTLSSPLRGWKAIATSWLVPLRGRGQGMRKTLPNT